MPFCPGCGSNIPDGPASCTTCGASIDAAAGARAKTAAGSSGMASNVAAMLSYGLFFVTGIIFLVLEDHREDKFVRFHAFQSIFYSVAYLIYWIVWSRLTWLGLFAPGFISIALYLTGLLVFLGFLGLWLFLMYKAYNNEKYIIPFIGELAAKQAG